MHSKTKELQSFTLSIKVLIPIFVFNLLIIIFGWLYLRNHFQSVIENQIKQRAEIISNSIDQILWVEEGVTEHLSRFITSLGAEKDVEIISVIKLSQSPEILMSSGEEEYLFESFDELVKFINRYERNNEILDSIYNNKHIEGIFSNISENDHDYIHVLPTSLKDPKTNKINNGVILVQLQATELVHYTEKNMGSITIILVLIMVILIFMNYSILQYYIFNPIYNIKKAIDDHYNGIPNSYVSNIRNDEIGLVSYALNSLFIKVEISKNELLEQTNLLNTVIENIPLCFFAKDVTNDYRMILWNKKSEDTFDIPKQKIIGTTDYDHFPKEEADFFRKTDEAVMTGGELVDIAVETVTTKRGTWEAHTIKVPVYDSDGKPRILIGMLENISERIRSEKAIKIANENLYNEKTRLQTIMDSMLEGIITINEEGIIQQINPGAEKMFGYQSQEIIGKNINILMPSPDKQNHDEYLSHYKKTKEARIIGKNRQLIGIRKNGVGFPMALSVKNMVIHGETMFIGLARDITEQITREKELEDAKRQAESANRLKSEFLSNMSHELRTPMHSIISFSRQGITHIKDWPAEKQQNNLSLIKESGDRLLILINDLLDLSKLEAGAFEYRFNKNDINSLIKSVIMQTQSIINEKKITVDFIHGSDIPPIECDNTKITQVLVNFLSNALKFTPAGKKITILTSKESNNLKICVEDEGIGIPEDELESVFDKFIQSSKTKSGAGGTGLGLAICKEIITGHKGKIWAENNKSGGARFIIIIPISQNNSEMKNV